MDPSLSQFQGEAEDNFKPLFKYYKSKNPPADLSKVLKIEDVPDSFLFNINNDHKATIDHKCDKFGLMDPKDWRVRRMDSGLIMISNPFTRDGISYWTSKCFTDWCQSPPYKTNLDKVPGKGELRWSTIGIHHNWDTKIYDEDNKEDLHKFPSDLKELSILIVQDILQLSSNYQPQAGIINYYPLDGNLGGHTDHSEPNQTAPLLSLSFGCSAIFLIGGQLKSVEPTALMLNNGDIMIMNQTSRKSYHAVPKIIHKFDCNESSSKNDNLNSYLKNHRINVNIRQVY